MARYIMTDAERWLLIDRQFTFASALIRDAESAREPWRGQLNAMAAEMISIIRSVAADGPLPRDMIWER